MAFLRAYAKVVKFFPDFLNVVTVGIQKLIIVFFDDTFDLGVELVNEAIDLIVKIDHSIDCLWFGGDRSQEGIGFFPYEGCVCKDLILLINESTRLEHFVHLYNIK